MQNNNIKDQLKNWQVMVNKYQKPDTKKAVIQLLNTFLPFLGLWVLMYFSLNWSYFFTISFAGITAFFLLRIFVIQHDCGHQSFLKSRKWNNVIGFMSSLFSSIPYKYWSRMHNVHHAHNGQYEYRGLGDINFLTTDEYRNRSRLGRLYYRIRRSLFIQFIIVPVIYLGVVLRYPYKHLKKWKKIRWPHFINNLMIVAIYSTLAIVLGWQNFLLVHIPVLFFFGMISFWLFYVQHQHEDNYKEKKNKWEYLLAAIRGSTYYKLPGILQWLSGNIGFHHIHHLSSLIPNYNLEACAKENPILNKYANIITFRQSLKCVNYKLWDEQKQQMISFKEFFRKEKGIL
ncbi:MAG: omega-6 fatty acid desaturase (delta-12 desaturase) [Saprospiraceae bacterium]|jgi:omega-6 fatty acid desaturase (delta-12 desaturase)